MTRLRIRLGTITAILPLLGAVLSRNAGAQAAVTLCHVTAYTNDPDPRGTNVRKSSSSKSALLATLKDSDTQIDITGSADLWLRIRQAKSVDGTVSFKGDGWVYASLMAVRARGAVTLRGNADKTSAKIETMKDDDQASVVGCNGEWMQVKHNGVTGWMEPGKQCGNPVTTCA